MKKSNMKKLTSGLLAGFMLATSLPVLADSYGQRHGNQHGGGWQARNYDRPQHHGYGYSGHRHNGRGAALGILGAGLALGAFAIAAEAARTPAVVVAPAPPPAGRMWYYCESAGAYYPYVNYCPEGWRPVYP